MTAFKYKSALMIGTACMLAATSASGEMFNIPGGDLKAALDAYASQSGVSLVYSGEAVRGLQTQGVQGEVPAPDALSRLLRGTGLSLHRNSNSAVTIVRDRSVESGGVEIPAMQLAQATTAAPRSVETVTVTSSKLGGGDVQSIPISITALSQEQLTATQTAGGPDLIKQVPNMTFTKTNFSGYSIQLRGIGTQAISVTTDPAVAVSFNDVPFLRNHFFEQEFFDIAQVQVLRGPQGTLYGRNATAGVVNISSAKPTDQFEALASGEIGNYKQRRFEGMVNLPILDDRISLRVAGEWTKRSGYSFNELTDKDIDGRNLWSVRATLGWRPLPKLQTYLIWERFQEDDDRLRSAKQLCKTAPYRSSVNGVPIPPVTGAGQFGNTFPPYLSQGCEEVSLYSDEAFQMPNGYALPYYTGLSYNGLVTGINPYRDTEQSRDLRMIQSQIDPVYKAKSDIVMLNADYEFAPGLTLTSQTAFNHDFLYASQDYNRFASAPGVFLPNRGGKLTSGAREDGTLTDANGVFCDPQLGCSDRLLAQDLVQQNSWQAGQEFRLASKFDGPFNFSIGGSYLHYETIENYYVFINALTMFSYWQAIGVAGNSTPLARPPWEPGVSDNSQCMYRLGGLKPRDPALGGGTPGGGQCIYIDPNPISNLNGSGHNYFRSINPYNLNSYAAFGEGYFDVNDELKLVGGLRWTQDRKHFTTIPSMLVSNGWDFMSTGQTNQEWNAVTGRATINWSPKLNFTDQTLVYGSFAHGYKAGGANPPGAVLLTQLSTDLTNPVHPLTFEPEYINAYELGSKNTLLDGALTLNTAAFYYDYKNYQISEIVDRTAINHNYDAHVKGAEVELVWEPLAGFRLNASGGYQDARVAKGEKAVDLMDRTAGNPDWMVVKPFVTQASNCILPTYVVAKLVEMIPTYSTFIPNPMSQSCGRAYGGASLDPVTGVAFTTPTPTTSLIGGDGVARAIPGTYAGFDPLSAPNGGQGVDKDLSDHQLPNAPPITFSAGAQYSLPVTTNWAATLRSDFYWQDYSWARVFNSEIDRIRGYATLNLSLILTSQSGWQVMGYVKNVTDTTAITGTFLNSDDSGLTTNVFLTDPRLLGVRITKNW